MKKQFRTNLCSFARRAAIRVAAASVVAVPAFAFADGSDVSAGYGAAMSTAMLAIIVLASSAMLGGVSLYSLFYSGWAIKKGLKVGGKG